MIEESMCVLTQVHLHTETNNESPNFERLTLTWQMHGFLVTNLNSVFILFLYRQVNWDMKAACVGVFICHTASDETLINGAEFTLLSSKWNPKGYLGFAHHYFSKIKQMESEASVVMHKIISTNH